MNDDCAREGVGRPPLQAGCSAQCNRTIDMTVVFCSRNVKEAKNTRLKRPQCETGCTARHRTLTTARCGADHALCVGCGGQGSRSNSHGHPHQPARPTRQGHSTLQLWCSGFQLFSTQSFKHWIDFTTGPQAHPQQCAQLTAFDRQVEPTAKTFDFAS